jgi:hypothetical protein
MRFMIIEKTRISFPAIVSSTFDNEREAKEYGYRKPDKNTSKIFKIKNGFKLIDTTCKLNLSIDKANKNTKEFNTSKITLYLKDPQGYCDIEAY